MQKEISIQEVDNKGLFCSKLCKKLEKSEEEYEQGKVHDARTAFKELRTKYGY